MAVQKILAREWTKKIRTSTGPDVYTDILGINSFTVTTSKQDADTTDFDSAGWAEHLPATRGVTISLDGYRMEDPSNGDRDSGQAAVEALALLVGASGVGRFKLTAPGGAIWTFDASAEVEGPGGDHQGAATWKCRLVVKGQITIS